MKIYELEENTSLELEDKYIEIAKNIKNNNPELPFFLEANIIKFKLYTVGELQIDDVRITIQPRNPALTSSVIFEMAAYTRYGAIPTLTTSSYGFNSSFGVSGISERFLGVVNSLLQYGLTGDIYAENIFSPVVKGKLVLKGFNPKTIPFQGIHSESRDFTINTEVNKIIKSALGKLLLVDSNQRIQSEIYSLLRDFDAVEEFTGEINKLDLISSSHFSSNPYYVNSIEYAIIILKDLKLNYQNGNVSWFAFLEDSNNLFEKYILKISQSVAKETVQKWETPKPYAEILFNERKGIKSYSPDVIVGYDTKREAAIAVMDAKNKYFDPYGNLNDIVEPADIYQILFYCKRLKTNIGALIYPSSSNHPPIATMVENENNLNLFLISINMTDTFSNRLLKFKKDFEHVLSYS